MFNKLKPKSDFSRNVLILMTGTTIAQAIPIAISPILTRIYTPEDFGVFALFIAITGLFSVVASGRYELALMLPKKEEDAINIFSLGILIIIFLSLILFISVFLFNESLVNLLNNDEIEDWLYFVPVAFFFIGLFNLLSYYNIRQKNYQDIANATIVKSIALATVQIIIGMLKTGATGLITGQIISSFFANMQLLKNILKDKEILSTVSKRKMIALAKQYKEFPKYQAIHAMLNAFSSYIPIYIFSSFFGLTVVGFYALSTRVVFTPLMILSGASGKVYTQQVTQLYNDQGDTYRFTISILKSLLKKMIIPFLLFVTFAPEIFGFIFGDTWSEAGRYTQILSPWLILNALVSTVAFIPSLTNMQKKAFGMGIVYMILVSFAMVIGVYYHSLYLSLGLYSFFASGVLLYNLSWMLKKLKRT